MERMTKVDRARWMNGTEADHREVSETVRRGDHQCDDCDAVALTIGHSGVGTSVRVHCRTHFLAHLDAERATRPSRSELIARVNAAVAG